MLCFLQKTLIIIIVEKLYKKIGGFKMVVIRENKEKGIKLVESVIETLIDCFVCYRIIDNKDRTIYSDQSLEYTLSYYNSL